MANFMVNHGSKVSETLQLFDTSTRMTNKDKSQEVGAATIFNELVFERMLNPSAFASTHLVHSEALRLQEEALVEIISLKSLLGSENEVNSTPSGCSEEESIISGLLFEKVIAFPLSQAIYREFEGDIERELADLQAPFYDRLEFLLQVKLYQVQ